MPSFKTIRTSKDSRGVLWVSLARPEIRNAFNEVMIHELSELFSKEAQDPALRAVVLSGEGPVFCAGGDLNWMKKSVEATRQENLKDTQKLTQMFARMNECPTPLIGLVQGAAIGGGVGLVSVCDIVIASADTVFSLSEVRLGIVPACIGPFVVAKVGASHARRYFVSAERFDAKEASRIGLVHEVIDDASGLKTAVEKYLTNLTQCGPNAVRAAKKLVLDLSWPERRQSENDCLNRVASVLADLRVSPEGQEGVRAFLEKRKPGWSS